VRTSKTVSGETTQYVLDLAATLPVVVSDTEAVYLYGLDILAQQQVERLYYFHDGLGNVRQLLDSTGEVQTNYAYDPFGVPVVVGDASNPYQFTGEAWDEEVELLYLRARCYQPETGRFITKDPWAADILRPGTLHRYGYVQSNPVNGTDPAGLEGPGPHFPELRQQEQPGYSPYASLKLAVGLGVYNWFLEIADPLQQFGPEHSLTQDVKHSPSLARFREAWKAEAEARGGMYPVPWHWYEDGPWMWYYNGKIVEGERPALHTRMFLEAFAFGVEHIQLGACLLGLGSQDPEGEIDPEAVALGSFNRISVYDAGGGMVMIEAYNVMGWASFTRIPGMGDHLIENRKRGTWGPGGTVRQWFYWYEQSPGPIQARPRYTM
jgi:RHS repeat-associated protein